MIKLVASDLDGTLLNTIADLGEACNYALRQLGYSEHALSTYNYMVGNGVRKLVERAEPPTTPAPTRAFRNFSAPSPTTAWPWP